MTSKATKDLLVHVGADALERYGTIWRRLAMPEAVIPTITRNSARSFVDQSGLVQKAENNTIPLDYWDLDEDGVFETKALLLEPTLTNLVTWSDALSNWTSVGTPVVTDAFATLGDLGLTLIEDDSDTVLEFKELSLTFTGDGIKGVVFYARAPDTPADGANNNCRIKDNTAGANRLQIDFSWNTDGTLATSGATTGTLIATRRLGTAGGKPVYAFYCQTTSVTAANAHIVQALPTTPAVAEVGKLLCGGFMVVDDPAPPAVRLKTTGITQTHNEDVVNFLGAPSPQSLTMYFKGIDLGWQKRNAGLGVFSLGQGGGSDTLGFHKESTTYVFTIGSKACCSPGVSFSSVVPYQDIIELRGELRADGSTLIGLSINDGAETTSELATVFTLPDDWNTRLIRIGKARNGAGGVACISGKVAKGIHTLEDMRNA